jgi:hypothetical protein
MKNEEYESARFRTAITPVLSILGSHKKNWSEILQDIS